MAKTGCFTCPLWRRQTFQAKGELRINPQYLQVIQSVAPEAGQLHHRVVGPSCELVPDQQRYFIMACSFLWQGRMAFDSCSSLLVSLFPAQPYRPVLQNEAQKVRVDLTEPE